MPLLGCCAVLEPRTLKIQYIDIDDSYESQAQQFAEKVRQLLVQTRSRGEQPKTIHPAPGVEPQDQAVLGALCATITEIALHHDHEASLKSLALAIYRLRPKTAFIIKAIAEEDGTNTQFIDPPCTTPGEARAAIENSQEIRMLRDFQTLSSMMKGDKPSTNSPTP
jgi:hypothetical protein